MLLTEARNESRVLKRNESILSSTADLLSASPSTLSILKFQGSTNKPNYNSRECTILSRKEY